MHAPADCMPVPCVFVCLCVCVCVCVCVCTYRTGRIYVAQSCLSSLNSTIVRNLTCVHVDVLVAFCSLRIATGLCAGRMLVYVCARKHRLASVCARAHGGVGFFFLHTHNTYARVVRQRDATHSIWRERILCGENREHTLNALDAMANTC